MSLIGKKIYLAPYNELSRNLEKKLLNNSIKPLGFVDSFDQSEDIINPTDFNFEHCDLIIISSPNYWREISKLLPLNKVFIIFRKSLDDIYHPRSHQINGHFITDLDHVHEGFTKLEQVNQNKRAFIIGNGPSLCIKDLESLKNEITFGCNKLYLAFKETDWRPTYFTMSDPVHIKSSYQHVQDIDNCISFFPSHTLESLDLNTNSFYYNELYSKDSEERAFSTDLASGITGGNQVTYVMLQILFYMGVSEIYLIGVDFNYIFPNDESENSIVCQGEVNHFHKDYFSKGEPWTNPQLKQSIKDFEVVKDLAEKIGIRIFNATRGGKLEVFPRVNFDLITMT